MKKLLISLFVFLFLGNGYAERKMMIYFTDKGGFSKNNLENGKQWLNSKYSPHAIKRRYLRGHVRDFNMQDFPLYAPYLKQLRSKGVEIVNQLRWFNAVSAYLTDEQVDEIEALPFVQKVEPVKILTSVKEPEVTEIVKNVTVDTANALYQVIEFVHASALIDMGLTGDSIIVGVFDGGFNTEMEAYTNIADRLIAVYDFVNDDSLLADGETYIASHGTKTSMVIGGDYDNFDYFYRGLAPGAGFILCKTEDITVEQHVEEDNWAAAAEFAEMHGVDIVSSSLGYSYFDTGEGDYTYADMDGETTIVTLAAQWLTDRGVIVVSAAGNEGYSAWHYITAPADGKKVISVGAVNLSGYMASFSSYGPTADGRLKPEVVAPGVTVPCVNEFGSLTYASGTSLACPVVAGGLALILEAFPEATLDEIYNALITSASIGQIQDNEGEPNNHYGYGAVDFSAMYSFLQGGDTSGGKGIVIYPNPVVYNGTSGIKLLLPEVAEHKGTIAVYNILGQKITSLTVPVGMGSVDLGLGILQKMSFGVYLVHVRLDGNNYYEKMVFLK